MFRFLLSSVPVRMLSFPVGSFKFLQRKEFALANIKIRFHHVESEEDSIKRYVAYFDREDIDHWEIRKAMNELANDDAVPDPVVIIAALKAARRLNDYALTVRLLETVQFKCGSKKKKIWPYILSEIQSTLFELGIETPEALGFDKPQLWCDGTDNFYNNYN
uniref:Cytochrome c oxidase subunit 5A, mitochondrial n=1 Tax=Cacopsylla melanoneura TaxID=428564 RepID=A0A8D9BT69_9HEMI